MDYVEACIAKAWHLQFWPKDDPTAIKYTPFLCRSWRHPGECRLWKGAQDFVRCKEAMEKRRYWSHMCLTYAQRGKTLNYKVFRRGVEQWSKLRKRLIDHFGDIRYIQTWEIHETGWPHVHVAISNKKLWHVAKYSPTTNWIDYIRYHAESVGFGSIGWLEPLRSRRAMAGYLNKLAAELTDSTVKSQVPVNAPHHFRRLRASHFLLPPVHKNHDITGVLKFCRCPDQVEAQPARGDRKKRTASHG